VRFSQKMQAYIGEHFIVRLQSPELTIGGGVILDPQAAKFRSRDRQQLTAFLESRRNLELENLVLTELEKDKYTERRGFLANSLFSAQEIAAEVNLLEGRHRLVDTNDYLIDSGYWQQQADMVL
jgi:hypothetical protein